MPAHVRGLTWGRWTLDAVVRAVQVGALAAISAIGTEALLRSVDWVVVAEIAGIAVVVSLLTSLAELPEHGGVRRRRDLISPPVPPEVLDVDGH